MTQNEKDILLKDLCSRLPYGVKVQIPDKYGGHTSTIKNIDIDGYVVDDEGALTEIEWARPYLFPLSSMTEEQIKEFNSITQKCSTYIGKSILLTDFYSRNARCIL